MGCRGSTTPVPISDGCDSRSANVLPPEFGDVCLALVVATEPTPVFGPEVIIGSLVAPPTFITAPCVTAPSAIVAAPGLRSSSICE